MTTTAKQLPHASYTRDLPAILKMDSVLGADFYEKYRTCREATLQKAMSEFSNQPIGAVLYLSLPGRFEVRRLLDNGFATAFLQLVTYMLIKFHRDKNRTQLVLHFYESNRIGRDLQQLQLLRDKGFIATKQEHDEYGNIRYVFEIHKKQETTNENSPTA